MVEKIILIENAAGSVQRMDDGSIAIVTTIGVYASLRGEDTARKYAHAILELIGEPVPSKGDDCYIAVVKDEESDSWIDARVKVSVTGPSSDSQRVIEQAEYISGEFHIFRRVATVGPIPAPEREVTRYE